MIKIKTFVGDDVKHAAKLVIRHRLFVPGWDLRGRLGLLVRRRVRDAIIAICYVDNVPVAVVVKERTVQAFCRKAFRRRGLTSKLMLKVMEYYPHDLLVANEGIDGSVKFWDSHNIAVRNRRGFHG